MSKEISHINKCDVCRKTDTHLRDVVLCTRKGIRAYLLCDDCYIMYKEFKRLIK